jgi:hypothetical protein
MTEIPQQHAQARGAPPGAVADVLCHVQRHGDLAPAVRLGPVVVDAEFRGSRVLDNRAAGRVWADIEPDVLRGADDALAAAAAVRREALERAHTEAGARRRAPTGLGARGRECARAPSQTRSLEARHAGA